jgi:ABC-type transporter Mla maintaining outer membrane lipid asymmetry ATPase subunit MlaF
MFVRLFVRGYRKLAYLCRQPRRNQRELVPAECENGSAWLRWPLALDPEVMLYDEPTTGLATP